LVSVFDACRRELISKLSKMDRATVSPTVIMDEPRDSYCGETGVESLLSTPVSEEAVLTAGWMPESLNIVVATRRLCFDTEGFKG